MISLRAPPFFVWGSGWYFIMRYFHRDKLLYAKRDRLLLAMANIPRDVCEANTMVGLRVVFGGHFITRL